MTRLAQRFEIIFVESFAWIVTDIDNVVHDARWHDDAASFAMHTQRMNDQESFA